MLLAASALIALVGTPTSAANDPAARVKDINPGPQGFEDPLNTSRPSAQMLDVGGKVFFPDSRAHSIYAPLVQRS
jgi:hypothetical protein